MLIYNTLTGRKEEFAPPAGGTVKIYVCGLTVYNFMHIGNARTFVFFDAVVRYLAFKGYNVAYARNYTDIDDKIINRVIAGGETMESVASRYIAEAERDFAGLNMVAPTFTPRVTQVIPDIIKMIETLINNGNAYETNGNVFFDTCSFKDYGKLSKKPLDELNAGARVEINVEKKNAADFALWKAAKAGEPGFDSPWGSGRPGWHIECSVMAKKYLGDTIDIHGGAEDLIFPHHENEIAQSETANKAPFSKYWMHARFVNLNNQKMAKSEGNFFTVREISEKYPYEIIRFFLLQSHYRSPVNFSPELLDSASAAYGRICTCLYNLNECLTSGANAQNSPEGENRSNVLGAEAAEIKNAFIAAMDDDFNTADAIAAVFEYVRFVNSNVKNSSRDFARAAFDDVIFMCELLGLKMNYEKARINDAEIMELIEKRNAARESKDFALADKIRAELLDKGVVIADVKQGATRFFKK